MAAEPTVDVVRNRVYVERESGPLAMDIYLPHGQRAVSGRARGSRRRVDDGLARAVGGRGDGAGEARLHGRGDQLSARAEASVSGSNLRLPGGRALAARACRRVQNRSGAHRRLRLLGRRASGRAVGHARTTTIFAKKACRPTRPARGCKRSWPAVRRATSACCRPTARGWPTGSAARGPTKPDAYRVASPAAFISADDPPMFFFHGAQRLRWCRFAARSGWSSC